MEQKHTPYYYVDKQEGDRYCLMDGNDMSKSGAYRMLEEIKKVSALTKENEELKAWKQSEIKLWRPILEYMHLNGHLFGMKLGESITDKVLEVLKANSLKL